MNHPLLRGMLVLGSLGGIGCDTSSDVVSAQAPLPGYPLAFIMHDCAPWDGPAIAIILTSHALDSLEIPHPYVRVVIYPREESLTGRTYRWPADPEMAAGTRCVSADSCDPATAGQITVGTVRPDSALEGRVQLRFASGEQISGGFRAVWLQRRVMCG